MSVKDYQTQSGYCKLLWLRYVVEFVIECKFLHMYYYTCHLKFLRIILKILLALSNHIQYAGRNQLVSTKSDVIWE